MKNAFLRGLAATLSLILVLAVGYLAADDSTNNSPVTSTSAFQLSGYTQARFSLVNNDYSTLFNNSGPTTFQLYRARLGLEGEIVSGIHYRIQFETARTPMLLDAMIDFTLVKDGFVRIGQFKVPFSQENLTSDVYLDTINLSQVVNKLCPGRDIGSNGRDIGAMADYRYETVEVTAAVLNGSGINKADPDTKKDIDLRATWSPLSYLSVGVSEYIGHTLGATATSPIYKRDRTGLELALNYDRYMLKAEYIYAVDNAKDASGFYIMGGYFILPKKLQVLVRYDELDPDLNVTANRSTIYLGGLNWFFTKKTKIGLNCELGKLETQNVVFSALLAQFQVGF